MKGQGADFLVKGKENDGSLGNKKEENLPGASVHPSHASKGIRDLKFRVENDVDMVFSVFICKAADKLFTVKKVLREKWKHIKIVSRI